MVCVSAQSFWSLNIENCCSKILNNISGCDCGLVEFGGKNYNISEEYIANRTFQECFNVYIEL